jgi:hypothetical protein
MRGPSLFTRAHWFAASNIPAADQRRRMVAGLPVLHAVGVGPHDLDQRRAD